tara:strand:+ start:40 stop:237 length:198 start_codon:yes stop_codon:yes gene_type:complete
MEKKKIILDRLSSKELLDLLDKALFAGSFAKRDKQQKYVDLQHKIARVLYKNYPEIHKEEGIKIK